MSTHMSYRLRIVVKTLARYIYKGTSSQLMSVAGRLNFRVTVLGQSAVLTILCILLNFYLTFHACSIHSELIIKLSVIDIIYISNEVNYEYLNIASGILIHLVKVNRQFQESSVVLY